MPEKRQSWAHVSLLSSDPLSAEPLISSGGRKEGLSVSLTQEIFRHVHRKEKSQGQKARFGWDHTQKRYGG